MAARKAKAHDIARQEYWDKVRSEPQPITLTPEVLGNSLLLNFHKQNGREFILDDMNIGVFNSLCKYFTGTQGEYDLTKGLMVCGNVGVGKTEMMRLFTTNPQASFGFIGCRQISDSYSFTANNESPEDMLRHYSVLRKAAKPHPYNCEQIGVCFDDLGTETIPAMNYGNSKNVMAEIIMNRYDNRLPYNMTHITTNLTGEKITAFYGPRFTDRIRQMFNQVVFVSEKSRR